MGSARRFVRCLHGRAADAHAVRTYYYCMCTCRVLSRGGRACTALLRDSLHILSQWRVGCHGARGGCLRLRLRCKRRRQSTDGERQRRARAGDELRTISRDHKGAVAVATDVPEMQPRTTRRIAASRDGQGAALTRTSRWACGSKAGRRRRGNPAREREGTRDNPCAERAEERGSTVSWNFPLVD